MRGLGETMDGRSPAGKGVRCEAASWWPNTDGTRSEHAKHGHAKGNTIDVSGAPLGVFFIGCHVPLAAVGEKSGETKAVGPVDLRGILEIAR